MTRSRTKKQHLVTSAYQSLWADPDGFVAVMTKDDRTWRHGWPKTTLRRKNFLTFVNADGALDDSLEVEFGRIEGDMISDVRRLADGADDQEARLAAAHYCAIHWARSGAMRHTVDESQTRVLEKYEPSAEALAEFEKEYGRSSKPNEIHDLVRRRFLRHMNRNTFFAEQVQEAYNRCLDFFVGTHIQVIRRRPGPAGFVTSDSPTLLIGNEGHVAGSLNRPALHDASEIWFPVGPSVGISFSRKRILDRVFSPADVQALNHKMLEYSSKVVIGSPTEGLHNAFGWPKSRLNFVEVRRDQGE